MRAAGRMSAPPSLPARGRLELGAKRVEQALDRSLERLQRHVARESVRDDDVRLSLEQRPALRVPAEPEVGAARRSSCASSVSWLPFSGSSPIERSRTSGFGISRISSASTAPMCANWTRCSGRASAFAPASMRTLRPRFVGITIAIPGRCTPGSRRMCRSDAASIAPVFPAETTASASPSATARTARTSDESGFERTGVDGVVVHVDRLGRLDELETVRVEGRRAEREPAGSRRGCVGRAGDDLVGRTVTTESVDGNADHARSIYGASRRSGSTSRPLYVLQFGQTRCIRFGCLQVGQTWRCGVEIACWARRLSRLDLDVFRFGTAMSGWAL